MSRGLGATQGYLLKILYERLGQSMPVRELEASIGGDRSNLRRVIRTLKRRGLLEEKVGAGGERCVGLTFAGSLAAMPPLTEEPDPLEEIRALREAKEQLWTIIEQRRADQEAERSSYVLYGGRRRLRLGSTQELVLAVVSQGIDGEFRAFETTYLKSLVVANGGPDDKSNLRRAVRSLLEVGYLEERLVDGRYYYGLTLFGYIRSVPLDLSTAPKWGFRS